MLPGTIGTLRSSFFPEEGLIAQQSDNAGTRGSGRIADLGPALDEYSQTPVFGQGFGTRLTGRDRQNAQILDNQWLKTLLETGLVGAFAWLWIYVRSVRRLARVAKEDPSEDGLLFVALAASITAFAVGMVLYDAFSFIEVTFLLFIVLALGWRRSRRASRGAGGGLGGRGHAHLRGRHAGAKRGRQPSASGRVDWTPRRPADDLADRRQRLDRRTFDVEGSWRPEAVPAPCSQRASPRPHEGARSRGRSPRRRPARRRTGHRRQGRRRRLVEEDYFERLLERSRPIRTSASPAAPATSSRTGVEAAVRQGNRVRGAQRAYPWRCYLDVIRSRTGPAGTGSTRCAQPPADRARAKTISSSSTTGSSAGATRAAGGALRGRPRRALHRLPPRSPPAPQPLQGTQGAGRARTRRRLRHGRRPARAALRGREGARIPPPAAVPARSAGPRPRGAGPPRLGADELGQLVDQSGVRPKRLERARLHELDPAEVGRVASSCRRPSSERCRSTPPTSPWKMLDAGTPRQAAPRALSRRRRRRAQTALRSETNGTARSRTPELVFPGEAREVVHLARSACAQTR